MKCCEWQFPALFAATLALASADLRAQDFSVNAGALATTNGAPLCFVNGNSLVTGTGFVFPSTLRTDGPAIGYYEAPVTFTAVHGDGAEGPPAAPGAQLALVIKSVSGPEGGSWAFWESLDGACGDLGGSVTFSLPAGATNGTNWFLLSQNNGLPGEDPYGHCHGRRFTMTKPGLYRVGVQIVDVSHNGPGGGSIHVPSPVYEFYFQAGATIARLEWTNDSVAATFATLPSNLARNYSYYLEANPFLDDTEPWKTVAGPVRGDGHLHTLVETNDGETQRFYRLRVTSP